MATTKNKSNVKGLKGAEAILKELGTVIDAGIDGAWLSDSPRRPTFSSNKRLTNIEVLEYLDEGGRSLYATKEDGKQAGKIITDEIGKHLQRTGRRTPDKNPATAKRKQMLAGGIAGVEKACKMIAYNMLKRMETQTTTDGSTADAVSKQYAKRRASKYGVNDSVVYVASGQLANALSSGKVKIFIKGLNP